MVIPKIFAYYGIFYSIFRKCTTYNFSIPIFSVFRHTIRTGLLCAVKVLYKPDQLTGQQNGEEGIADPSHRDIAQGHDQHDQIRQQIDPLDLPAGGMGNTHGQGIVSTGGSADAHAQSGAHTNKQCIMALILMKQIIVLFLMMGCGLAVVKLGMLKVEDSKALSVVSLYLLLPSVVIHSFDIEYTPEVMSGFLLALAAALAFHGILFVICTVLSSIFHLGAVEKCSLIYTNAGNIIMPLVAALLGEEWQIYATAFLAVQMTILFSHGQSIMEGKPGINWKKIVTNPNMIAVVAGLVLFLTPLQLPDVLADTMTSMARAVGPVSMIMLGMALADIEWKKIFTGKRVYSMVLARMVLLPLVAVFFLRTWGMMSSVPDSRSILLVTLLAAITPTASTIPQMAQLYDQDAAYASAINVMTTVVCVVTMPLMVMLYMM